MEFATEQNNQISERDPWEISFGTPGYARGGKDMKFKETLMFAMFKAPKEEYEKGGFYRLLLMAPYFIMVFTLGILIALIVDFLVATESA